MKRDDLITIWSVKMSREEGQFTLDPSRVQAIVHDAVDSAMLGKRDLVIEIETLRFTIAEAEQMVQARTRSTSQ